MHRLLGFAALAWACLFGAVPAQAVTLQVGYIPIMPMAQLFVMEGEGWADQAGLNFEFTRFSDGPAIVQALASGKLDIAYVGIGPAMVARASGIDLRVVASNVTEQVAFIGRGDFASTFQNAENAAAAFKHFHEEAGRPVRIATLPAGSVPHAVLRYYLEREAGVDMADVEIVGMGADKVQHALLSGAVDAASIMEPILTVVQQRDPSAKVLARGGEMLPNQPGAVVVVRQEVIAEYREAVQDLVELHLRATDLIKNDPKRAAEHIQEFIGRGLIDTDTLLAAMTSPSSNFEADPHAIVESTRTLHDFQAETGTLKKPVPFETLFDFTFHDAASKGASGAKAN
jgi:NitT/TauT family transport system substrate-binding protein